MTPQLSRTPLTAADSTHDNQLLGALPAPELQALTPDLEWVRMLVGDVLYEPGQRLRHAYFPTTAVVSLLYLSENGDSTETCSVGREGVVGMPLFMCSDTTLGSAVVQTSGHGFRVSHARLAASLQSGGKLLGMLLRHTQALLTQIAQTVACNRHHTIEQQFSRWLLSASDRLDFNELVITHELMAGLLGVRRESISQAAAKLQAEGYIRYRRGHISVIDKLGLESATCECYAVVKSEIQRLTAPSRHPAAKPPSQHA